MSNHLHAPLSPERLGLGVVAITAITVKGTKPADKVRCALRLDGEADASITNEGIGQARCEVFAK
jgi:hypothetical protein